ncbi:MAG: tetratricopeptide repeat protein, partial [Elusimicrobia bacterium]|nr:tetratricopeptide repeat protein [Elusimicrobiota bacterium]
RGVGEGEMEYEEEIEEETKGEGEEGEGEEIKEGEELEEEEFEKMTYKPLKFLEDKDYKKLAYLLNFEKPDIAALIIDYLDASKAVKVMASLPADKKYLVAKSMVKVRRSSKEVMQHVDDFLSKKIDYVTGGAEKLVSMIELMPEEERESLLENLSQDEPEFAEKIKSKIFSFDDIISLDEAAIQMLIQAMETQDIGMALKNASEEIKEKFMENMSEGAAALLKEEIEFGKKLTGGQIKNKQQEIVAKIKELESDGTISGVTGAGTAELWDEELGEDDKEAVLEGIIEAAHEALDKKKEEEVSSVAAGANDDETAFKFYEQGLQAYKKEDYNGAIEKFERSQEYNASIWQTHQYLGSCYMALANEAKAKEEYQKSLSLNPDNAELAEWVKTH